MIEVDTHMNFLSDTFLFAEFLCNVKRRQGPPSTPLDRLGDPSASRDGPVLSAKSAGESHQAAEALVLSSSASEY